MKILILSLLAGIPLLALADDVTEETIKKILNVETMQQLIQPTKVVNSIYTPFVAWYVAKNDIAPSCALIDKDDATKILELMSPSDGQFTNCHQAIDKPVISFIGGSYYATYRYVTEETRASFSLNYQIVRLTKSGFHPCGNDETISQNLLNNAASRGMKLRAAIENALTRFGCVEPKLEE